VPQDVSVVVMHAPRGSGAPSIAAAQVPFMPPVSAAEHAMHAPVQSVSQQKPSTQELLWHAAPAEHGAPVARRSPPSAPPVPEDDEVVEPTLDVAPPAPPVGPCPPVPRTSYAGSTHAAARQRATMKPRIGGGVRGAGMGLPRLAAYTPRRASYYDASMSGADLSSLPGASPAAAPREDAPETLLARVAAACTAWSERWIPDAYVFALAATAVVLVAATASGARPAEVLRVWGDGFWELLTFTLQMALIIITGYVVATTRPVYRAIARLAALSCTPRGAVAMVAFFAMASAWVNWGFSLIFSAMLAKEVARRMRGVDYRAVAASAFLGLGSIWAQGLSGSAALQMATKTALPEATRAIVAGRDAAGHEIVPGGVIPLSSTIFLWQSLASVAIEIAVVTLVVYRFTPAPARARSAADLGVDLGPSPLDALPEPPKAQRPGEILEHAPWLTLVFAAASLGYLGLYFAAAPSVVQAVTLNTINLALLTVGAILHGTPARLMRAVREATPSVWGVILQFPFYAGIAAVITKTHLNAGIAAFFIHVSTARTFPAIIALYSAVLGVFVPSGGSKWVIEAPYVMAAAHDLGVHLGWMVAVYDLGEAVANLVQPFWMLPVLGLFGLRARDVMGYTFVVFVVLLPLVIVLATVLGATLPYPL
jgi:short-chain fatty acids transporter